MKRRYNFAILEFLTGITRQIPPPPPAGYVANPFIVRWELNVVERKKDTERRSVDHLARSTRRRAAKNVEAIATSN